MPNPTTPTIPTEELAVVDFQADWCAPCKIMSPIAHRVTADLGLRLIEVDVDENPELASRYAVMSIPTLLVFSAGQPVERIVGAVPERELRVRLAAVLA